MRQDMQSVRQGGPVASGLVRPVLVSAVLFMAIAGLGYPLVTTWVAELLFHHQAQGSIITENGAAVGSELIGQPFIKPEHFHPRPSATTGTDPKDPSKTIAQPYNAANSGATNLGPTSKQLVSDVTGRVEAYRTENGLGANDPVPVDAVTASASGLDPDISITCRSRAWDSRRTGARLARCAHAGTPVRGAWLSTGERFGTEHCTRYCFAPGLEQIGGD